MRPRALLPGLLIALQVAFLAAACGGTPPPQVAAPPQARPSTTGATPAPGLTSADVDRALEDLWKKGAVTPSAPADDATFLRRAWIDLVGTLPPPERVTAFLADARADKRARAVDELLASDLWAAHWVDYWEDELVGRARSPVVDRAALRAWLEARFKANAGWDQIVSGLVAAEGVNSTGERRAVAKDAKDDPEINGAVNWLLRFQGVEDAAGSASRMFLGVQIQCAQCHDHKTEAWKQDDFRQFAACFARTRIEPLDAGKMGGVKRVRLEDVDRVVPRVARMPELAPIAKAKPRTLDGKPLPEDDGARKALAAWLVRKDNPWFAKATVNRMWGHFLGRGFVDPVDDLRPSNPADAPELLDALAKDFAEHGFDLKRLARTIVLSRAYQLAAAPPPGEGAKAPIALWSRFRLAPLAPTELVGVLFAATDVDELLVRSGKVDREELRLRILAGVSFVFDVDEELDRPSYEGTLAQALLMLNGRAVEAGASALPTTALRREVDRGASDAEIVTHLYLRTLSRPPTKEELARWQAYVEAAMKAPPAPPPAAVPGDKPGRLKKPLGKKGGAGAGLPAPPIPAALRTRDPRVAALEDVYWALLNSSELFFNH